jgi:hypothetical protein
MADCRGRPESVSMDTTRPAHCVTLVSPSLPTVLHLCHLRCLLCYTCVTLTACCVTRVKRYFIKLVPPSLPTVSPLCHPRPSIPTVLHLYTAPLLHFYYTRCLLCNTCVTLTVSVLLLYNTDTRVTLTLVHSYSDAGQNFLF